MRRFHRETAAAFGDAPDRDVEAEFGASASVSASVSPPTLRVLAPPSSPPKPAPAPAKPKATLTLTKPKASVKVAAPARPAVKAPAYATAANQANFLDGGSAPIVSTVKAPAGTVAMTQAQRDANARALQKEKTLATAERNAPYFAARAKALQEQEAEIARLLADPGPEGQAYRARRKFISSAGVDVGQIVMGAKVLAVGASVIATGGAVAGAVGITAGGASLATAAAADRLVAAVEKGGEIGAKAKGAIDDVKAAAAKGDKAAKDALAVVNAVASGRVAAGVAAGVEQTLTAAGKDAANAVAGIAAGLSGSGSLNMSSVAANLAAAAPSSGGFVDLRPSNPMQVVSSRPPPAVLSSFAAGTPRWLVTPDAKVVDLKRTPSKASARGFVVTTTGKVEKQ